MMTRLEEIREFFDDNFSGRVKATNTTVMAFGYDVVSEDPIRIEVSCSIGQYWLKSLNNGRRRLKRYCKKHGDVEFTFTVKAHSESGD